MTVHILTPYDPNKNLGMAYNRAMSMIPDGDWACFVDYDVLMLTPDCGNILHGYAERYPHAGLLTCFVNRIHHTSPQLYPGMDKYTDIKVHINKAEKLKKNLYQVTEMPGNLSGFLMMIKKETWKEIPFTENMKCLGVDTDYVNRLKDANKRMLRMNALYVFHIYRMMNGIKDKSHLL